MDTLETILSPLIALFSALLELLYSISGSYGISIMTLSLLANLALTPIAGWARKTEQGHNRVMRKMEPLLAEVREDHRGRERFERTEAIYQAHGYHPVQSMASLLPLLLQLPLVLAAFLLLRDYPPLEGLSFLLITDLSRQDMLAVINVLPLLVILVALLDSAIRTDSTAQSRRNFLLVSVVMAILIYRMPSAVCLYWLTTNLWSLGRTTYGRLSASGDSTS